MTSRWTDHLDLKGGYLRVVVDQSRGAQIVYFGPPDGPNLLAWYDWDVPIRASQSVSYGSSVLDWLSEYRGGWQELLPNAGQEGVADGVPTPFHGEISTVPWEVAVRHENEVLVRAAARLPLIVERRMRLAPDRPVLFVEETVTNISKRECVFVWGHHPAFRAIPGSRIEVPQGPAHAEPALTVWPADVVAGSSGSWPMLPGPEQPAQLDIVPAGPARRLLYLPDRPAGWAVLHGADDDLCVGMAWDVEVFPHLWIWLEAEGPGFPWYGRARILAVEPQSAWPADGIAGAVSRGQAHRLDGGDTLSTWLTVVVEQHVDAEVRQVERDGRVVC